MAFNEALRGYQEHIENLIKTYAPKDKSGYHDLVNEAMLYSLLAGGKRIRPTLVLATYALFGPINHGVEAFAVAIEMIHTYSLIHDDLPAMDNDDLRRGKATCHIQYGEDLAILAGDGLLNRAFEVMLEATLTYGLGENGLKAAKCLGEMAGTRGMIGGQVADISYENKVVDLEAINYIHLHKTSALLEASFMMGAYLAGQSDEVIGQLQRVGRCIGLAFQIQDDLLDITSTEAEFGKPIMSDQKNHKTTYVDLKGIDGSKEIVAELLNEASALLKELEVADCEFLLEFVEYIRYRTK